MGESLRVRRARARGLINRMPMYKGPKARQEFVEAVLRCHELDTIKLSTRSAINA